MLTVQSLMDQVRADIRSALDSCKGKTFGSPEFEAAKAAVAVGLLKYVPPYLPDNVTVSVEAVGENEVRCTITAPRDMFRHVLEANAR